MTPPKTELVHWIRLALCENVGPVTFRQLIASFGTPANALEHIHDLAKQGGRKKPIRLVDLREAEAQITRAEAMGATILTYKDAQYPTVLKTISDAPPVLWAIGDVSLLNKRCIGIVGTRNASINGKTLARHLSSELAKASYVIVSGMARGIDRAAHIGALESGKTIAVLGGSIDDIYPKENVDIYDKIKEFGCILSEQPFGSQISPKNFPRRNRIISGLSDGVVVIEAHERSGSLITAKEAASQGREVFAVPGSPIDPRSSGPNSLIRDGATLVTSADDVLSALSQTTDFKLSEPAPEEYDSNTIVLDNDLTDARDTVIANLGPEAVDVDSLLRETGLSAQLINIILVELELANRLERHPGNRVSLLYTSEKE